MEIVIGDRTAQAEMERTGGSLSDVLSALSASDLHVCRQGVQINNGGWTLAAVWPEAGEWLVKFYRPARKQFGLPLTGPSFADPRQAVEYAAQAVGHTL